MKNFEEAWRRCAHRALYGVSIATLAFAVTGGMVPVLAQSAIEKAGVADPENWPQYHRTYTAWRYSPLDQINRDNIKKLKVAWIHQPGDITHGIQATPIVIDGVLYYISAYNNVHAVDAATGKTLWHYQPKLDPVSNEGFYIAASRGVTVGRGKVFVGTLDGRMLALDQQTGKEAWSTQVTDPRNCFGCLFSSPPQLAGAVLFGGTTGGDQPQRGKIYAVNADTGKPTWTFDTIRDDPASWPGDTGEVGGGGAWLPGTYDPETDTIYIGTSNAAPDFFGDGRKGDNLYTASLLALDAHTGKLKWHRQEIPHDVWDYDAAYEALLIHRDGKDVIAHLNKSGFVFVMAKDTGELQNVWPLSETYNWVKSIDPKTGELIGRNEPKIEQNTLICPYLLGVRSWNHGAYSPKTGLWYSNAMEVCQEIVAMQQEPEELKALSALYLGVEDLKAVPPPGRKADGRLDARDPVTGELKWSVSYEMPALSSVLATGGGLVFNGDMEGNIFAYDAESGQQLWTFHAGSGLRGGPISYAVDGKQYLVFPTGLGSHAPGFMASAFPKVKELPGGAALIAFTLE
jgi:alcohol dehydrogenase (cytochrome c)